MKSNTPLLKTLLVAAVALSFCATPAWAEDDVVLTEEATTIYPSLSDTTATVGAADYVIGSGSNSGWIFVAQKSGTTPMQNYTTIAFEEGTTFSGEGLFGIYFQQGFSSTTETVDLTNVDAGGLSGQLSVENAYNNVTIVKVKGDTWSNVEYLFGDAEGSHHGTSGDTLTLTDSTTFAGISGTTAGAGESITVNSAGTTLTIAGTGTYSFYGTVGESGTRASLVMNSSDGTGSQTFGGTNYLQDVTVSAGTLALGGTTSITGAVSVTGGTLDISGSTTFGSTVSVESGGTLNLAGEITLSNTITNSGTVVVDSNVVFVLDSLTPSGEGDAYTYTIISGGTISGWDSLDYSNFGLDSARQLTSSSDGTIVVDTTATAQNLTWNGTGSGDTWNNNVSGNTVWTNDGGNDYFVNGDNVTFGSTGAGTITLGGAITAGSITFTDGSYTISNGSGTSLTAGTILVEGSDGSTVTIAVSTVTAENINFANHSSVGSADNTNDDYKHLVIGDGTNATTATAGSMSIAGQSEVVVAEGSTLTVSGTITSQGGYHTSISGAGTLIADSLTQNAGNNVLDISIANLQVGTFTKAAGTLTFSGGSATIGTMTVSAAGNITFKGEGTYTIGSYSTTTTAGSTLTLGEYTQVTMGTLSAAWHETVTLGTGATLTVTEELSVHTATTDTFSGGTINAEKLNLYNNTTIAKFSDTNLNIGSGGIVNTGNGYVDFGDGLTVGVYEGANGENTSWSTDVAIQFTGTNTGTTFNTNKGESIALSGVLSGEGSFTKDGAGTLELSGTNTFTGGVTVSAGTVVAKSETALGTGDVTIKNGGQLSVSEGVTISNNINIILSTENRSNSATPNSVMTAYATDSDVYALIGTGSITGAITITVDEAVAKILAEEGEYIFDIYDTQLGDLSSSITWNLDALTQYQAEWNGDTGQLILRGLPEPELFSIFFGLGALGLVATKRRRRQKVA